MSAVRMTEDHPRVRASLVCTFCKGPKDTGLVACWDCFRTVGLKYGDHDAEHALNLAELDLAEPDPIDYDQYYGDGDCDVEAY